MLRVDGIRSNTTTSVTRIEIHLQRLAKFQCKKRWYGICLLRILYLENIRFPWYGIYLNTQKNETIFIFTRIPPYNDFPSILDQRQFQLWRWYLLHHRIKRFHSFHHVFVLLRTYIKHTSAIVFKKINNKFANDTILRYDCTSSLLIIPWRM